MGSLCASVPCHTSSVASAKICKDYRDTGSAPLVGNSLADGQSLVRQGLGHCEVALVIGRLDEHFFALHFLGEIGRPVQNVLPVLAFCGEQVHRPFGDEVCQHTHLRSIAEGVANDQRHNALGSGEPGPLPTFGVVAGWTPSLAGLDRHMRHRIHTSINTGAGK